jgi:DNA-binding HxlR family transcriptional regulator
MSLTKQLRDTLKSGTERREDDAEFKRLSEFLDEMKRRGLVVKKHYNIPPMDTVGKYLVEQQPKCSGP